MAHYIVRAKPILNLMDELRARLDSGEIREMQPFGRALQYSLEHARVQDDETAVWEEEDYCIPPLAQERAAVLDTYFRELSVEKVERGEGWKQLEELPTIWGAGDGARAID
jgi:hypothetical protein